MNVHRIVTSLRNDGIDLAYNRAPVPAVNLIYDVMKAAGVPDGGIALALGQDIHAITEDEEIEPVTCCVCGQPAFSLVESSKGTLLACPEHAKKAQEAGLVVVTPNTDSIQ